MRISTPSFLKQLTTNKCRALPSLLASNSTRPAPRANALLRPISARNEYKTSRFLSSSKQVSSAPTPSHVCASGPSDSAMTSDVATIGGGCFWCLDACYRQMRGVLKVESGYAGGQTKNPTYQDICTGTTGHAEVVQITYDPSVVSYMELLEVFFTIHDPTTKDRQGNDRGTQYRSVIFYHSDKQKEEASAVMKRVTEEGWWANKLPLVGGLLTGPLVTELSPIPTYYPAEKYHQDYYNQNPNQGYCMMVVAPKISKLRSKFMSKLIV